MLGLRASSVIVSRRGFECHHCCANNIISSSAVSVTLQLCKQLLFPPLICHIRTYFGGWSWQVFYKYEKHTTAAKPRFEVGTSFHWGFLVASPAVQAPLGGPKGAAVKIVAFRVPPLPSPHHPGPVSLLLITLCAHPNAGTTPKIEKIAFNGGRKLHRHFNLVCYRRVLGGCWLFLIWLSPWPGAWH